MRPGSTVLPRASRISPASPAPGGRAGPRQTARITPADTCTVASASGGLPLPSMSVPARISIVSVIAFPPRASPAPSPCPLPLAGERESQRDAVELHHVAGDDPVALGAGDAG